VAIGFDATAAGATPPAPGNPLNLGPHTRARRVDLRQLGSSGLKQFGGFIYESTLRELDGRRAIEVYKEMGDNDATCGTILYLLDKILRQVKWRVAPASTEDYDVAAAEFVESCMHDMEESWIDFLSEAFLGMLRYGYSLHETVYKRRAGDSDKPHLASRYADGRIGWRAHAGRAQETIYRWLFDDTGRLLGAEQLAPPHYAHTVLPLQKCLLFRTSAEKNNPEGRSIFRSSYRSYYLKRGIENIEGVGVERDVAGLPVAWCPRELMLAAEGDGDEAKAAAKTVESFVRLAQDIRRDAQEGVVMPLEYDESGNKRFDLTLLSSGGSRQFDTDKIIQRYDQRIAMGVLADFIMMGQSSSSTGSFSMHSDKTALFFTSITAFLDIFTANLNDVAVRRLMELNTLPCSANPKIEYGSLEQDDVAQMADSLLKVSQAGMPLFPDPELEAHVRRAMGWPERVNDLADVADTRPQQSLDEPWGPDITDNALGTARIGQAVPQDGLVQVNVPPPAPVTTNTQEPQRATVGVPAVQYV